jgi:hypothetical protein
MDRRVVVALLVVLVLAVGGFSLLRAVDAQRPKGTDAEQIQDMLYQGERAAERRDASAVSRLVSKDYNDGMFNAARARYAIGDYLRRQRSIDITIPSESVSFQPGPGGKTGVVRFRLLLNGQSEGGPTSSAMNLTLTVVKEPVRYFGVFPGEEWRITSAGGYEGLE